MTMETAGNAKPKGRQIHKLTVSEIRDLTPSIRELFLNCSEPDSFRFRAGQFVTLHVPVAGSKAALRAYSIASSDQRHDGFRLIFKYVENGVASNYVWSLKGGETLDFTGPFGRIFFREPPTPQLVFLNTGSGVSQHISFIESNVEKYPELRYRLLFGVRSEADIYYAEELARLKRKLRDFEYEFVLSRPSTEWSGKKGYVQDFIADFAYQQIPTTFYLCGNTGMINATKATLLTKNFDSSLILSEAFD